MDVVVRKHTAARLALVRSTNGQTRWMSYSSQVNTLPNTSTSSSIELQPKEVSSGCLDLDTSCFPNNPHFKLLQPHKNTPPAQNLLLFLHGRGDSHEPFAQFGAQMALPQTAILSLRAPHELPFGLGFTWMDDLDANGDAIPPEIPHKKRSKSLQEARDFVWSFLQVLHNKYEWNYSRLFVFAFSQGACVAFQLALTLPQNVRLGGIVLVAGGAIIGEHSSTDKEVSAAKTPILQVTGTADTIYPVILAKKSRCEYGKRYTRKAAEELFASHIRLRKSHTMIDSREDMQPVMLFFSKYLYLRNFELENRSDIIELQT